ncbi:E3 ubiquitin-protein ligase MARCHF7-like [Vitis riparia]|uniref:E3 ubiquitin-protein ligase MARCHF7-like n=1 Tax=Vitis riparia TaxID=96939 RepID=UPI00155A5680|nr:E3 ubiquitin-protein ligase MARCHF7-like [Vitis riparia]
MRFRWFSRMLTVESSCVDVESNGRRRSGSGSTDGSLGFSDSDGKAWLSPSDECRFSGGIEGGLGSSSSDCGSEVDLESGVLAVERDCRICQLSLDASDQETGLAIELGCSCKGDLGSAHRQCAETWFKIKGNTTCEICHATAVNVAGEQINEAENTIAATTAEPVAPAIPAEPQRTWHGRRVMNVLLACMIVVFVISWLFHFNVIS